MTDPKTIAKEVALEFEKIYDIDPQTHKSHHRLIDELADKMERRRVMWDGVKKQVFGWGILVVLGGIGKASM